MLYYLMSFTVRIQKVGRGSQFSTYVLCSMTVAFDMLAVPGLEVIRQAEQPPCKWLKFDCEINELYTFYRCSLLCFAYLSPIIHQ